MQTLRRAMSLGQPNSLKHYLLRRYPSLSAAAADLGVSRNTLYNYISGSPEQILRHMPEMILRGKSDFIGDERDSLIASVLEDYIWCKRQQESATDATDAQ